MRPTPLRSGASFLAKWCTVSCVVAWVLMHMPAPDHWSNDEKHADAFDKFVTVQMAVCAVVQQYDKARHQP